MLKDQLWVSPQRGMPVGETKSSQSVNSISGETILLYYWSSGTRTIDAGQAAGVVVEGKTAYSNILNNAGATQGTKNDKSISFTSTAFTTEVAFPFQRFEELDAVPGSVRSATIAAEANGGTGFANGDYCIDYRTGMIYGKKASTQVSLTSAAYKVPLAASNIVVDTEFPAAAALADATANPTTTVVGAMMEGFNGTTWDRIRVDSSMNLKTAEQYAAVAEDNTNGIIAQIEKPLATNTYAPSIFLDAGTATTLNIKSSAGNLLSFWCSNANAAVRYFQIHNTATTPAGGATALWYIAIPAGGTVVVDKSHFPGSGLYGGTGLAWAVSTTAATYTAATAGEHTKGGFYK